MSRDAEHDIEHDLEQKALDILVRLESTYGKRTLRKRNSPLRVLISTILSQRTTAKNERAAFNAMWSRYGGWAAVRDADITELTETLRPANYAPTKAKRIQVVLAELLDERGRSGLSALKEKSADEILNELTALRGVGLKTASIVALFCFGKPVQPVDTHVHRVSLRLGLLPKETNADKAHTLLRKLYPPEADLHYSLHVALIRHGRRVCKSVKPRCGICTLRNLCDFAPRLEDGRP